MKINRLIVFVILIAVVLGIAISPVTVASNDSWLDVVNRDCGIMNSDITLLKSSIEDNDMKNMKLSGTMLREDATIALRNSKAVSVSDPNLKEAKYNYEKALTLLIDIGASLEKGNVNYALDQFKLVSNYLDKTLVYINEYKAGR